MPSKIKNLFTSFFARRLTTQIKELYSATLIFNFAIYAILVFEPVFLFLVFSKDYALGDSLKFVLLFYLAVYIFYFWTMPLGAKFAKKFGYEKSIALGTVFTVLFYLSLFAIEYYFVCIIPAVLLYTLSKVFYWPAYHGNFAKFSVDGEQGREISNLAALGSFVAILGPLVGGFLIELYGFNILFIFVSILILISNIPMLITKEEVVPSRFNYWKTYQDLFEPKNRRRLIAYLGFGEELLVMVIWPIFIYLIIRDFLGVGLLTAASVFITTVIFLMIGKLADQKDRRIVSHFGTVFYFFGWLMRLMVRGTLGVFLVDSYSRVAKQSLVIPMTAKLYEDAQDGHLMREVVFFEMSLVLGKIIALVLSLIVLEFFVPGWNAMFILGSLMTLLYLFL